MKSDMKTNSKGHGDKKKNLMYIKWKYSKRLFTACVIGFTLSLYAIYVEHAIDLDDNYTAMCDLSERISCTKIFSSIYGKGFGLSQLIFGEDSIYNIPNGLFGICYYVDMMILSLIQNPKVIKLQFIFALASLLLSFYLAYILMFVLHDFCIVCFSIYFVNVVNAIIAWKRYKLLKVSEQDKKIN